MHRNLLALAATAMLCAAPAVADEMTLEEVLAGHYEAIGGLEAWGQVTSAKMVGKMSAPGGFDAPFTMMFKIPDKSRLEFVFQGMTGVQAVNGDLAWQIMPFHGKPDPEPMPDEQARLMIEQTDFDGPLVNWEEEGHYLEYMGLEDVEGTETHKIKVTRANGDIRYYFLDADALLTIKSSGKATIQGQEHEIETIVGDYKEVGGLVLPHSIETKPVGAPAGHGQVMTIDTTELNLEMADDQFAMPSTGS